MAHPQLKNLVKTERGRAFRSEFKKATADSSNSILNRSDAVSIRSFSWEMLKADLTQHCNLLLKFLQLCVPQSKRERAGGVLSLIIAMLAKFTNQRARLVQTVISLVLLAGHATKQVGYLLLTRLHAVGPCSHAHLNAYPCTCVFHPADTTEIAASDANYPSNHHTAHRRAAADNLFAGYCNM